MLNRNHNVFQYESSNTNFVLQNYILLKEIVHQMLVVAKQNMPTNFKIEGAL